MAKLMSDADRKAADAAQRARQAKRTRPRNVSVAAVKPADRAAARVAAKQKRAVRGKSREVALQAALDAVVRNDARRRGLDGSGLPDAVKVQLARKAASLAFAGGPALSPVV